MNHAVNATTAPVRSRVCFVGVMSGLTLGLLSLDRLDLEVMLRTGNKKQQKFAKRLFPMIEHPHWVLATLVITNTLGKSEALVAACWLWQMLRMDAALHGSFAGWPPIGRPYPADYCHHPTMPKSNC